MKVTNKITIHLDDQRLMPPVDVMQCDAYTRVLECSLYSGGTAWTVPDGVSVAVAYRRADGSKGIYDTLPDGSAACTVAGNVVTAVLVPQALAVSGATFVTVLFTDDTGKQLTTFCVKLNVERNPAVGATKPEDYINLRQWMSAELVTLLDEMGVQPLYITLTANEDGAYTADKDMGDIQDAYESGRMVFCALDHMALPMVKVELGVCYFAAVCDGVEWLVTITNDAEGNTVATVTQREVGSGGGPGKSVKHYGAKGDGATDDTAAFQGALAAERVVFVPGGTYVLSGTLVIRENCCLTLSQDTILRFTQTEGNCIELRGSGTLRGNHAIIWVPYAFTGNVISLDTLLDGTDHATSIPPYGKSSPMFKRQRFVYDVNIIKSINDINIGFCTSADGKCSGTAIYMSATNIPKGDDNPDNTDIPWMWAISMSGIRIAGGFTYGIHAINYDTPADSADHYEDDAWNHDMRIEAVIAACEIGVALENCNGAHLAITVEPGKGQNNGAKYAKHGVYLKDARFVDMIGSRVWDWNANTTLWTSGGEYQHLAMIGNCQGLLLDDFLVHESNADIRDLIYTDTPSNYDKMTVLQEPTNKWFKSVGNKPYFYDGTSNRELRLRAEKITAEETYFIHSENGNYIYSPKFTNLVSTAIDTDGSVYSGKGYQLNAGLDNAGGLNTGITGNMVTGFIPLGTGPYRTYRIAGQEISFDRYGCNIAFYDGDFKCLWVCLYNHIGESIYWGTLIEEDSTLITLTTEQDIVAIKDAAYIRVSVAGQDPNLIVTIDEKLDYDAQWQGAPQQLDKSIHAKNDWNAAEGEVGHIENRTHYRELTELLPETMATFEEGVTVFDSDLSFTVGETYIVNWGGATYTCVAWSVDGIGCIGNKAPVGLEDTGEPFTILNDAGLLCAADAYGTLTEITVSISGYQYVTLPRRYLPKMCHVIEISSGDVPSVSNGTVTLRLAYDTTDLVKALEHGLPVYLKITGDYTKCITMCEWCVAMSLDTQVAMGLSHAAAIQLYGNDIANGYKYAVYLNLTE